MAVHNSTSPPGGCSRPLRTVLIGTSLEDESDGVVRSGLAVARAAGARVVLVHAALLEPHPMGFEDVLRQLRALAEGRLREQIARLGVGDSELAGAEVREGAAHRILIEAARQAGADLIVVGATGSGPLAAELLGSTADRILRKAACPVLVVRGELRVPPRRVLAPVDLSELSADAFRRGLDLLAQVAKSAATEVRAVYALSFLDTLQHREHGETSPEEAERHSREKLQRFVLDNRPDAAFEVETGVLSGEARFEILHELEERPADLVLLGTHGRGGLDRLMLGSVASTVARKAPCSVLLMPPDQSSIA